MILRRGGLIRDWADVIGGVSAILLVLSLNLFPALTWIFGAIVVVSLVVVLIARSQNKNASALDRNILGPDNSGVDAAGGGTR
jgi:hypothetical protein